MSGGTISTAVICVILAVICIFSVKKYRKKLTSGCCGVSARPGVKINKVKDRDKSHYPYRVLLKVDGMSCGSCAARVENALNALDGVWAQVDLGEEQADVRMKREYGEQELKAAVKTAGYTVYRVEKAV